MMAHKNSPTMGFLLIHRLPSLKCPPSSTKSCNEYGFLDLRSQQSWGGNFFHLAQKKIMHPFPRWFSWRRSWIPIGFSAKKNPSTSDPWHPFFFVSSPPVDPTPLPTLASHFPQDPKPHMSGPVVPNMPKPRQMVQASGWRGQLPGPGNSRPYDQGLLNHWFPLIRPY